jgi:hypothetical protein
VAQPKTVEALLEGLDHPLRDEIALVRQTLLDADPSIAEGVKWNAPSFRTSLYFATVHLRSTEQVQLVFHTGAKPQATAETGLAVEDPTGLLKWLARDRALVSMGTGVVLRERLPALSVLVRSWIGALPEVA